MFSLKSKKQAHFLSKGRKLFLKIVFFNSGYFSKLLFILIICQLILLDCGGVDNHIILNNESFHLLLQFHYFIIGFPWWLRSKESSCNARDARDTGLIPESGRSPWRRKWQPTPVFLSGKSHGQRSLTSYSPWFHKESDMTEHEQMFLSI